MANLRLDNLPSRGASLHPSTHPDRTRSPLPSPALPVSTTPFYLPPPSPLLAAPAAPPIRKASLANLRILRDSLLSKRSSGKSAKPSTSARASTASASTASTSSRCESPSASSIRSSRDWANSYSSQTTANTSEFAYPDSPTCDYSRYLDERSAQPPTAPQPHRASTQQQPYDPVAQVVQDQKPSVKQVENVRGELCFCGAAAEQDSIYCGVKCGRLDAMRALCSSSSTTPEPMSAPLVGSPSASSCTSASSASTAGMHESHYRRIEYEHAQRERERQKARKAERGARRAARAAAAASGSTEGAWVDGAEEEKKKRGPRSATTSDVPSLSSSSTTSSALSSPLSPTFPASVQAQTHAAGFHQYAVPASPPHSRPTFSSRFSPGEDDDDLFAAYQTTPKQQQPRRRNDLAPERSPESAAVPVGIYDDEDEPSLLSYARGLSLQESGEGPVGMGYMQFMAAEEERDRVQPLQPRARTNVQKHTRGKLSFDDVLNVMGA